MKFKNGNTYMFKDLEEYAEMMGIPKTHPQWQAFEIIWRMSRTPALDNEEENLEKDTE